MKTIIRRKDMKTIKIKEEFEIPGTDYILEAGDKIKINEYMGDSDAFGGIGLQIDQNNFSVEMGMWGDTGEKDIFLGTLKREEEAEDLIYEVSDAIDRIIKKYVR